MILYKKQYNPLKETEKSAEGNGKNCQRRRENQGKSAAWQGAAAIVKEIRICYNTLVRCRFLGDFLFCLNPSADACCGKKNGCFEQRED